MNLDDQLSAFLGETPKQSRADIFTTEVIKRVEQQAFLDQLKGLVVGAGAIALVLWACAPALNAAVSAIAPSLAPTAAMLAFVAAVVMAGGPGVWRRLGLSVG
ncbi:hypothetical protein [Caulobacter segnis]